MKKLIVIALLGLWQSSAWSMDLSEYLQAVQSKHRSLQALDAAEEAVQDRKESGDLELTPTLTLSAQYTDDKKEPNQLFQFGVTESKMTQYSLGLNKKFSTGTIVGLSANAYEFQNPGATLPPGYSLPPGLYLEKYGTGSLGLDISQSLWRDFFGNATRLRWERENNVAASQKGQLDLQKRQLLIGAETAYWNFVYEQEELKLRQASLERAKKIEAWTSRRVNDGISDRADLLQTQALVAQRQLQLLATQNDLLTAQKAVRDYLELADAEATPELKGDISARRSLSQVVGGARGKIVQLDAYVAALDAKAKAATAMETKDSYRPDLVLHGSYNTNSYQPDLPNAVNHWGDASKPTATVGVNFTYLFDTDAKSSAQSAADKDALSAKLTSERKMLESESAWSELNRTYGELSRQIESAQRISDLQTSRAKAQVDKFNKGRSVTTDVVNAEQDAAEAELSLTKLKSEQRKMEAQGRLFIAIEE